MTFDPRDYVLDRVLWYDSGVRTLKRTFEVAEVFPGSIADAAGIEPGYIYLPRDSGTCDPQSLKDKQATGRVVSRFVDPRSNATIEVTTDGYPFGMALERPLEALCADIDAAADRPSWRLADQVIRRVHDEDDETLATLAKEITSIWDGFAIVRLAARLLKAEELSDLPPEFRLIAGVNYAVQGDAHMARAQIDAVLSANESGGANMEALSLALYGKALIIEKEGGGRDEVDHLLEKARFYNPDSRRVRRKLAERLGHMPQEPDPGYPRPFPLNYVLANRDPLSAELNGVPGLVSLKTALARLQPHQLLVIVLLHRYRANGFYSSLAYQFGLMLRMLKDWFAELHVVTGYCKGDVLYEEWLDGERFLRRCGLEPRILYDPDGMLGGVLDSGMSPDALIVDKSGQILYRGSLQGERGYWTALHAAHLSTSGTQQ